MPFSVRSVICFVCLKTEINHTLVGWLVSLYHYVAMHYVARVGEHVNNERNGVFLRSMYKYARRSDRQENGPLHGPSHWSSCFPRIRQFTAVPKLYDNQLHQLPEQRHAEDHSQQTQSPKKKNRRVVEQDVRSTTVQIFNRRIYFCEKHLRHQQGLYHVFIDFKKAFDMI